jgi:hypothetical protein
MKWVKRRNGMGGPVEILRLVERFGEHIDSYQAGTYNEEQLRLEFLNPFFEVTVEGIDRLVYELYGLTAEEIGIVEEVKNG